MKQNEQTSLLGKCLTTYIRQLDQHNNIKSNIVYVTTRPYKSRKLVVKKQSIKVILSINATPYLLPKPRHCSNMVLGITL